MTQHPDRPDDFDRLLGRLTPAGGDASCPDPETMAAFTERALGSAARASVVRHAAGCARCQAVLAVIAKTDAVPDSTGASELDGFSWWRRFLAPRWLVPLSAAATALVLWTARAPQVTTPGPLIVVGPAAPVQESRADQAVPPPGAVPPPTTPEKMVAPVPPRQKTRDTARAEPPAETTDAFAAPRPGSAPSPDAASGQEALATAEVTRPSASPAPPAAPAAANAAAPLAAAESTFPVPPADEFAAGSLRSTVAQDARGRTAGAVAVSARPALEIVTPDPQRRWRWTGRELQLSIDGGATWISGIATAPAMFTAGSCPSVAVCWLVGRRGLVWRTIDGASWQPLTLPADVDLATVTGITADAAIVTAADGHRWATTDGGRTWTGAAPAR